MSKRNPSPSGPSAPQGAHYALAAQAREKARRRKTMAMQFLGLVAVAGAGVWWVERGQDQFFPKQGDQATHGKTAGGQNAGPATMLPDLPDIPVTQDKDTSITAGDPTVTAEPAKSAQQLALEALQQRAAEVSARYDKEPLLLLTGTDATRDVAKQRDAALLQEVIDSGAWTGYRKLLNRSMLPVVNALAKDSGPKMYDSLWKEPAFYQAFLRWNLLNHLPEASIQAVTHDSNAREMLSWLLNNPAAMEETLLTIKPQDQPEKVLVFLKDAWTWDPQKTRKYYNLALATAVVFDKEIKARPTSLTESNDNTAIDPLLRYIWYVERDEAHDLAMSVANQTARDLTWVVCAPIEQSELDWAIKELKRFNKRNWGEAYGHIKYLMERAVKGVTPYKAYTFAEIEKEGGICGDQTYFCANTARAAGIPAMSFSGVTDLGAHAWAALKIDANGDKWNTNVGRIGGVSKGLTDCAQIGKPISEQEVWQWNDTHHVSAKSTQWTFNHLWLANFLNDNGLNTDAAKVVRLANDQSKSFVETWDALYDVMAAETKASGDPANPDSIKNWKKFTVDMRREFRDNPRMSTLANKAEEEFIFPYGNDMDAHRTLARERRRIDRDQDTTEQKDLIAESLKREADLLYARNGAAAIKEISQLYDRSLRNFGGNITAFKKMANDYFAFCKDDQVLARKAARDVELAFKRVVETGTSNWFRAKTESEIHQTICNYYRQVGEPERAELLEKRIARLMRDAERDALK